MTLALLAAAPKGPLDTWSPTLLALFALLLPLIALAIVLAFTIDSRRVSAWIAVIFTLAAAVCTVLVVAIEVAHPLHLERSATFLTFFTGQVGSAAEFTLQWGVLADPLAAVVSVTVALVSLLVQIYALAFMRREDGVVRFFCVLLFATFAMLGVTLSTNYFEMLMFFGLVTLSTYLMIGHWWQREETSAAASRAFIISALGDLALLAAVAYIYFRYNELNFQALSGHYTGGRVSANGLFVMAILVFIAAAAKSAQFPLHVWLPGSAQAPAPAAALIHSAGSAICGVYLIARAYGLFHANPRGLALLAIAGGLTAVLGVLWALFQDNLKRAIAYTTMSELGVMVLALGIGAYGASIFELFTHAWPKALLFLAAGVIIRELRTERLAEMGGLWRRMRFTGWLMLIAVAAGAGIPPFSTFWSKDAILSKALALGSPLAIAVVVVVTFIGAMALVRIFALVFTGETARRRRFEPDRIRDAGGRLALAMAVLAIACVVSGIRGFRGRTDPIAFVTFPGVSLPNSHYVAAGVIAATAVLGAVVAFVVYARRVPVPAALQPVRHAMGEGLFIDRAYRLAAVGVVLPVSRAALWVETRVVDGALDLVGDSIAFAGQPRRWLAEARIRPLLIGFFAGVVALGTLAIVLAGGIIGKIG
ncbi:MAG TPA: proton-conducting transporter membrane subunit [Candidatus Dormibacteraeota bacterium]|nr:proton-conducting transporter membrane subunit [Candidatus Dormibacteraeota bacterium]